jgi:hypothetical protein
LRFAIMFLTARLIPHAPRKLPCDGGVLPGIFSKGIMASVY